MISWMQKHRKYLVVTIWISTIAFVGAGFVGWGSYDYGSMGGSVAKVGKVEITKEDFGTVYSNVKNYYAGALGGNIDEKRARELNLEGIALQTLINQALLKNFADELEMRVSDEEVAAKLASMEPFLKGGRFDKERYLLALKNVGLSPKEFENGLKNELLIQKVTAVIEPSVKSAEILPLKSAMNSQDRVSVKILDARAYLKEVSEGDIKAFWEKNKSKFKKAPKYNLETVTVHSMDFVPSAEELKKEYAENGSFYYKDGKKMSFEEAKEQIQKNAKLALAKKDALRKYVELKDSKIKGQPINDLYLSDSISLPPEVKIELQKQTKPGTIKPILVNDSYVVIKVVSFDPSKEMSFEEAKGSAKIALQSERALADMKKDAESLLKNGFEGVDLGFVSKNNRLAVGTLSDAENAELSEMIATSKNRSSVLYLSSKTVLFKILEQKLLDENGSEEVEKALTPLILRSKAAVVNQSVLEYLKGKYEIKLFVNPQGEKNNTSN